MSKIMIAVDLSSYSAGVVAAGIELARSSKAPVVLLTILDKAGEVVPLIEAAGASSDELNAHLNQVVSSLEVYKETYPDVDITVNAVLGAPNEDILEQVTEQGISTLVMGTHGRTGLDHLLIGSTAEFVIRHSPVPVLVVPYKRSKH
ncbi:Nucleotide-binding universal stress protein, UspA family [Chitinophaga sp. YR627]|jgi:nucleotide-binding universal stress UspA family protein|uniref:universal stress protein n=1 Tax=Chitinophaga sp. YR627 TaxID=1881041 RepID=UPI0008E69D12|nr:universal stress protein [Chitinophaga sp. YR627]SFN51483.1 Nucleotide-binding universal stress protein, UspA family [Chitinophaga sp. YR627]